MHISATKIVTMPAIAGVLDPMRKLIAEARERYEEWGLDEAEAQARLHELQRELADNHRERVAKLDEMLAGGWRLPDEHVH